MYSAIEFLTPQHMVFKYTFIPLNGIQKESGKGNQHELSNIMRGVMPVLVGVTAVSET